MATSRPQAPTVIAPMSSTTREACPGRNAPAVWPRTKKPPEISCSFQPELKVATSPGTSAGVILPPPGQRPVLGWAVPATRCALVAPARIQATPAITLACAGSGWMNVV